MELDLSKIDPKHLKISYPTLREGVSRRDLLFGLLKPQYEIVPAVEEDRCLAWRGCSLCISSCPQEAISLKGGSASIDKDKCTACGACLPSCPAEAISSPLLDPQVLDASLQSLFRRDETGLEPRVALIASEDVFSSMAAERESFPPQLIEFKLPCIGALSPWLLLRFFDLGVDGVAIVPCAPSCPHRCQSERTQRVIGFIQALFVKLGMEPERVQVFPPPGAGLASPAELLHAFVEEVRGMAPTKFGKGQEDEEKLTLVALLRDFAQRFDLGGACLSGDNVPFGLLKIEASSEACTLCGSCADRCPTRALTLKDEQGASQLLFDHGRCVACEACVGVCPEHVLQMGRTLDFSRLEGATVLAHDCLALCRKCGNEIAPLSMMRKIQSQLAAGRFSAARNLTEFCPDCRILGSPALM